jgi:hypothetical protein
MPLDIRSLKLNLFEIEARACPSPERRRTVH